MNYKIYLIIGSILVGSTSCFNVDKRVRANFYYENLSGQDLEIKRFNAELNDTLDLIETFIIKDKQVLLKNLDTEGSDDLNCSKIRPIIVCDSIVLKFSNDSIVYYKLEKNSKDNILKIENYTSKSIETNFCEFKYTFK